MECGAVRGAFAVWAFGFICMSDFPRSLFSLASSLNADRIRAATNAWSTIETAVQARILLAVASMRKSAVSSCAEELEELFRTAQGSGVDDWGCIMGQMFRTFAVDGRLSADIDSDTHHNLISQLSASRKTLRLPMLRSQMNSLIVYRPLLFPPPHL